MEALSGSRHHNRGPVNGAAWRNGSQSPGHTRLNRAGPPAGSRLRSELVVSGANCHLGLPRFPPQHPDPGGTLEGLATFRDRGSLFRRQEHGCRGAHWDAHAQVELPRFPGPFTYDLAVHRIVTGFDPVEVADWLGADDDLVKAHGVGRGVDARRHLVKPLADRAAHRMVDRKSNRLNSSQANIS